MLLDAQLVALVSDFGMSTALKEAGDGDVYNYASSYVRVDGGELPVRWAAIEVLRDGKYSRASVGWLSFPPPALDKFCLMARTPRFLVLIN